MAGEETFVQRGKMGKCPSQKVFCPKSQKWQAFSLILELMEPCLPNFPIRILVIIVLSTSYSVLQTNFNVQE